jgi:flagellar biosynthesis protein FlhB
MSGKDSGQEKTEAPSPKKLKEAKDQGQTPRTQDLSSWASIAAMAVTVPAVVAAGHRELAGVMVRIGAVVEDPDPAVALDILVDATSAGMLLLIPLTAAALIASVAAFAVQGGVHLAWPKLKPDIQKINPIKGIKRIFGVMTWWEGAKTLIKTTALVLVAWWAVDRMMPSLMGAGALSLGSTMDTVQGALIALVQVSVAVGVVMAGFDYMVQKRKSLKDMRMTKQEVKEENKTTEGNPLIKQAIRSRQIQTSRNRMMAAVADADVVVVNPTHYAVALRYSETMAAPTVVAKGVDLTAARIRGVADEHRVPILEAPPLARALYAHTDIGQQIPEKLYTAVAEVLAYVFQLKSHGTTGLKPLGEVDVPVELDPKAAVK